MGQLYQGALHSLVDTPASLAGAEFSLLMEKDKDELFDEGLILRRNHP